MLSATLHCCWFYPCSCCLYVGFVELCCLAVLAPPLSPPPHSPLSCDVVSFNQSGVLKHNTLTLGMLYQGGGQGQGRSSTLNFNLYNNTRHESPAGHWLPLPPPPSAITVSIPTENNETLVTPSVTAYILLHFKVRRITYCRCQPTPYSAKEYFEYFSVITVISGL